MEHENYLADFSKELQRVGTKKLQDEKFDDLAFQLMNHICLTAGTNRFRITECEFYYFDIDHPGPYVHQGDQQMLQGQLYLNKAGGLDITFGTEAYPSWGGILIRGIKNLQTQNTPTK